MEKKKRHIIIRVSIDIAGFGLLIIAVIIGPLPGPGGIPIFLAGLSLLATNHLWAKKALLRAKDQGTNLYAMLFPDNKKVKIIYDILGFLFAAMSLVILNITTKSLGTTIAIMVGMFGVGIFLTNRKRLEKMINYLKQKLK